jgi:hypothetical protein
MAKTYVFNLFVLTSLVASGAGATNLNRSTAAVKNYFQMQAETPLTCELATKQSKTPFDNSGTCTPQSCPDTQAGRRSFNISGEKIR